MQLKPFSDKQKEVIDTIHKYRNSYIIGGQGSGKTTVCTYYCYLLAYKYMPGLNGIFGSGTSIGQLYKTIIDAWEKIAPKNTYKIIKGGSNPRIEINCKIDGKKIKSTIYLASGDSPKAIDGVNAGWAYIDEIQYCEELFRVANTRLRQTPDPKRIGTGIPQQGWLSELYEKFPDGRENAATGSVWMTLATSDNPHVSGEYQEQQLSTLSPQEYAVKALGKFSANPDQVYPDFDRATHVRQLQVDPTKPTYIGMDFNNRPFASAFFQIVNNKIYQFDEVNDSTGGSTTDHARIIIEKLADHKITNLSNVTIFPDASGNNKQHSGLSDFVMLQQAGLRNINSLTHNPLIKDRDNTVRAILKNANGESSLLISPECKWTIQSFQKLITKGRERSEHNHIMDAIGYALIRLKPLQQPQQAIKQIPSNRTNTLNHYQPRINRPNIF